MLLFSSISISRRIPVDQKIKSSFDLAYYLFGCHK